MMSPWTDLANAKTLFDIESCRQALLLRAGLVPSMDHDTFVKRLGAVPGVARAEGE